MSPYPDTSGEPYQYAFRAATAAQAGTEPAAKSASRCQSRAPAPDDRTADHRSGAPGMTASGTRFGRVRIAAPVANPHRSAAGRDGRTSAASATVHHAATGRSLIGACVTWNNTVGLAASRTAAATPTRRP